MEYRFLFCLLMAISRAVVADKPQSNELDSKLGLDSRLTRSTTNKSTELDCSQFSDCTSCVSLEHPCIWCVENRICTDNTNRSCQSDILITGASQQSYRAGPSFCPRIAASNDGNEMFVPNGIQKIIQAKVHVDQIPLLLQARYQCYFDIENKEIYVNATLLGDTIYCESVKFEYTSNTSNLSVPFFIIWNRWRPLDNTQNLHVVIYRCNHLSTNPTTCAALSNKFNCAWCPKSNTCEIANQCQSMETKPQTPSDCNHFHSCTSCVTSEISCDWCIDSNRCTKNSASDCRNDVLVTGNSSIGPSYRKGPSFCPSISAANGEHEILIANGTRKSLQVRATIIGQFIVQTRFVCQFNIEGKVTTINAQLLADTIFCDTMEFLYTSEAANITVPFAVIWGGSKPLDNPKNVHVNIYSCDKMANNITKCLTIPQKYGCSWCPKTNKCELSYQCLEK